MKGLKIDTKKIAMQTVGNGVGLVGFTLVNKIGFVKKQSPLIRGIGAIVFGRLGIPFIAGLVGMGKKNSDVADGASSALATLGVMQIAGSFETAKPADKKLFPSLSGISGYENSPYVNGVGLVADEEVGAMDDESYNVSGPGDSEYYGD